MSNLLMRMAVETWFALTSRNKASLEIRKDLDKYLALGELTNEECGALSVFVPPMPGIDDDMRDWSFFMILEHNAIVNRSITAIVESLARGEEHSLQAGSIRGSKSLCRTR